MKIDLNNRCPYLILYEDEEILAVYKKREVFSVQTDDKKTYRHNLFYYLKSYLQKKGEEVFLVHRLDYETSGVMIFAKSKEVQSGLKRYFEGRKVLRLYEAVVPAFEEEGVREVFQTLNSDAKTVREKESGKEAITLIEKENLIQIGQVFKIQILTGRKNQIRMALASIGAPIIGDARYGNSRAKRMYLNAYHLEFPKETGLKRLSFTADPLWLEGESSIIPLKSIF